MLGDKIHLPQEEIDQQDKSLQKNFRRRVARATPNRLVRDFGTPEQEAKTERSRAKHCNHHLSFYLGSQYYHHWGRLATLCLRKRWSDSRRSSKPSRTQDMEKRVGRNIAPDSAS